MEGSLRPSKKIAQHILIRLISFPITAGLVYVFMHYLIGIKDKGWGEAFFAGASILSLVLVAEIILFFTKKETEKIYYNIGMIFFIFLAVVATIPFMK